MMVNVFNELIASEALADGQLFNENMKTFI